MYDSVKRNKPASKLSTWKSVQAKAQVFCGSHTRENFGSRALMIARMLR